MGSLQVAKFHHLVHCTGYFDHHNVSTDRHHVLTTRLHDEEPTTRELFDQIDANGDGQRMPVSVHSCRTTLGVHPLSPPLARLSSDCVFARAP